MYRPTLPPIYYFISLTIILDFQCIAVEFVDYPTTAVMGHPYRITWNGTGPYQLYLTNVKNPLPKEAIVYDGSDNSYRWWPHDDLDPDYGYWFTLEDQGSFTSDQTSKITVSDPEGPSDTTSSAVAHTSMRTSYDPFTFTQDDATTLIGNPTALEANSLIDDLDATTTSLFSTTPIVTATAATEPPALLSTTSSATTETLATPTQFNIGTIKPPLSYRTFTAISPNGTYIGIGLCTIVLMAVASPSSNVTANRIVKPLSDGLDMCASVPNGSKVRARDVGTQTDPGLDGTRERGRNVGVSMSVGGGFAHPGRRVVEFK